MDPNENQTQLRTWTKQLSSKKLKSKMDRCNTVATTLIGVERSQYDVPINSLGVGRTRPCRVRFPMTLAVLQQIWCQSLQVLCVWFSFGFIWTSFESVFRIKIESCWSYLFSALYLFCYFSFSPTSVVGLKLVVQSSVFKGASSMNKGMKFQ